MMQLVRCLLVITCLGFSQAGFTGIGSQSGPLAVFKTEDIARFSKSVEHALASRRTMVALVARNGRSPDALPPGVNYTHVGFAVYSVIQLKDGTTQQGYAFHNLYQQEEQPDRSVLVTDLAPDFFAATAELKAGVIIPKPELQRKLWDIITSKTFHQLHNPEYSAIANPFNSELQNCTEFVMNVTQAAIYDTTQIQAIKANLRKWFSPYRIPYGKTTVQLAAFSNVDIKTEDHGYPYLTATYGTIAEYMAEYELVTEIFELRDDATLPIPQRVPDLILDMR